MTEETRLNPLSSQSAIDHATLWQYMQKLVDRLFGALDGDAAMDEALDIVVDLLGADRGIILVTRADGTQAAINARSQGKALSAQERERISTTFVRDALETNRCVVFDPRGSASPSASATTLNIFAVLAAPLRSAAGTRGVLYVDFRDRRKFVAEPHIEFFISAATLIGAVLEQHTRAMATSDQLRGAKTFWVESRRAPSLAELLAPRSMQPIARELEASLHGDTPILILGESGSGKTLLAQAISEASNRRPIVRAVLGSSDDLNTITSELFGHERGAYSGAVSKRVGLVEFASDGTLILDEVLNLPTFAQRLLLDFTQFGTYRPLGYDKAQPKQSKVRIIGATNGDLHAAMRDGRFREDLYHRLAGVVLEVPPLRERREDLPALAEVALHNADSTRQWSLSDAMRRLLVSTAMEWPGNVRQLETMMRRARERALVEDRNATIITPEHVDRRDLERAAMATQTTRPADAPTDWQSLQAERARLDEREEAAIRATLNQCGGVVAQAARELGLARTTLLSRMDTLGIRVTKRA